MQTYDPNAGLDFMQSIPEPNDDQKKKGPPTGLLRDVEPEPENKVGESQMADFSTPIEEVMAGPGQMMQDEMMGPAMPVAGNKKTSRQTKQGSNKNPFNLTDEQYQAALAGVAAIIAFSKPVQSRLTSMVPKALADSGELSLSGMILTALVAAIVFYFGRQFLANQ
jgi:hypothetical protein